MTEKDYSLLRPFEPVVVKAGAKLVVGSLQGLLDYVAGPDKSGWIVCNNETDVFVLLSKDRAKVPPLCWVEGKPVYPGGVLWQTTLAGDVLKRKAKQISADGSYLEFDETGSWAMNGSVSKLSWAEPPPKPIKRWINIYPANSFESQDSANEYAASSRIACIEIELPPIKP